MMEKVSELKKLLYSAGCDCCPLTDNQLYCIIEQHPNLYDAAYHACLHLANDTSIKTPDGLSIPNQEKYWLRIAQTFRRSRSGAINRADEVTSDD